MAMTEAEKQAAKDKFMAMNKGKNIPASQGGGREYKPDAAKPADTPQQTTGQQLPKAPVSPETPPEPTAPKLTQIDPEPEAAEVPAKTFTGLRTKMGGFDVLTVAMSMRDIIDYTSFAQDLYEVPTDDAGEPIKGATMDARERYQRDLDEKRASKAIAPYLFKDHHFFPAIVCFPVDNGVSSDGNSIELGGGGLGVLDGQHRKAGIHAALAGGADPAFADESMPVTIIINEDFSIHDRQQVFSDINRNPKTVTKALNILFDHRDKYAVLAQQLAEQYVGNVDLERNAPNNKSYNFASLSNVYNLCQNFASMKPGTHDADYRDDLTEDSIKGVVSAVLDSMPLHNEIIKGHVTYGVCRKGHIIYSSTVMQAVGLALKTCLAGLPSDILSTVTADMIKSVNWDGQNPLWSQSGLEVMAGTGKIGTGRHHVANCSNILIGEFSKVKPVVEVPATPETQVAETGNGQVVGQEGQGVQA